jgi:hypothetical protein
MKFLHHLSARQSALHKISAKHDEGTIDLRWFFYSRILPEPSLSTMLLASGFPVQK